MYDDGRYYHCGQDSCGLCGGYIWDFEDAPFGCPLKNEEKKEKQR